MAYDEEKTTMDVSPEARELKELKRDLKVLVDSYNQLSTRVTVLEVKDNSARENTAKTSLPSRSEFLAAVKPPVEKKSEPNAAIDALKVVGPWVIALISLLTMVVQALLQR